MKDETRKLSVEVEEWKRLKIRRKYHDRGQSDLLPWLSAFIVSYRKIERNDR